MKIKLVPGTYVVAVSGGVDSMVLLDLLVQQIAIKSGAIAENNRLRLVVAHLDHGMREDSLLDRRLVEQTAAGYGLPFVHHQARLGAGASEATARRARYDFLHKTRAAVGARAIITAHHQDDLLETAVLNLLRGTGRRGLTSLKSTDTVARPLLHLTKPQLYEYAKSQNLTWREDKTNQNTRYLRNHIRHNILPRLNAPHRQALLDIIRHMHDLNEKIEALLINHLHVRLHEDRLERHWFIALPHDVSREVLHAWLRRHRIKNIDRKLLERLVIASKTLAPGRLVDVDLRHGLWVQQNHLALKHRDR